MWNVHSRVQNNTPRTNNVQEGFHSAFNRTLPVAGHTIWHLIRALRKEALAYTRIISAKIDRMNKRRKNIEKLMTRMPILLQIMSGSIMEFLKGIASDLHLF